MKKKCGKHRSIMQCLESYVTLSLAEVTTQTTDQKFCWKFSECETNKSAQWSYQVNLQHKHHVEITPKGVCSAEATLIWRLQNLLPLSNLYLFLCLWPACVLSSVIKIGHRNDYIENETDDKLYQEDRLMEKPSDKLWTSQLVSVWWGSGVVGYSV